MRYWPQKQWEALVSPASSKRRLVAGSMYLTAFDLLRDAIVERVKSFYADGCGTGGPMVDPKYHARVLSRNASPVHASLDWLIEHEVIDRDDLALFDVVNGTRDKLARALSSIVGGQDALALAEHAALIAGLLDKIERWWAANVDIPIDPEVGANGTGDDPLLPGSVLMLQMMRELISENC